MKFFFKKKEQQIFTFISGIILSGMWFKQVIPCRQFKRLGKTHSIKCKYVDREVCIEVCLHGLSTYACIKVGQCVRPLESLSHHIPMLAGSEMKVRGFSVVFTSLRSARSQCAAHWAFMVSESD